jgi:hypothetical protein
MSYSNNVRYFYNINKYHHKFKDGFGGTLSPVFRDSQQMADATGFYSLLIQFLGDMWEILNHHMKINCIITHQDHLAKMQMLTHDPERLQKDMFYFNKQQFSAEFLHAKGRFQSNVQEADLLEGVFYSF